MRGIKNSMFLLLGIFVMCLFSQDVLAQEQKVRKKGDKIRTEAGKQRVIKGNDVKRPAIKSVKDRAAAKKNQVKKQQRPINTQRTLAKPNKIENKVRPSARPANRPAIKNNSEAVTKGRLSGIKKGQAVGPRMSAKNSQAMRSGHAKLKGMRTKLNAAKTKVAKEKAANPNSADVKAKEARIRQAEAKVKAMEQELRSQRAKITRLNGNN